MKSLFLNSVVPAAVLLATAFTASAAMAESATCAASNVSLVLESTGGLDQVGQTLHAKYINSDVTFGETADFKCVIEKEDSGIYCVSEEPNINHVLTLTDVNSKRRVTLTQQYHGGYSSSQSEFDVTCN